MLQMAQNTLSLTRAIVPQIIVALQPPHYQQVSQSLSQKNIGVLGPNPFKAIIATTFSVKFAQ
ncbi:hypothetical protein FHT86_006454 [Rhizobium sp. BK313]|nr:hypothetical protein [Rhizobium sp. BK313]